MTNHSIEERLTAYALGELDDGEQAAVEKLLETDDAARTMLLEIREAVGLSEEALKAQPSVALESAQRAAIKQAALSPNLGTRRKPVFRRLALAASLLIVFGGIGWVTLQGLGSRFDEVSMVIDGIEGGESMAQLTRRMADEMPGVERYFIRDINNPATSALIELDYDDPQVQQQIVTLYEQQQAAGRVGQDSSVVAGLSFQRELQAEPEPKPAPLDEKAESLVLSSGLQNVEVGGARRVRNGYFAGGAGITNRPGGMGGRGGLGGMGGARGGMGGPGGMMGGRGGVGPQADDNFRLMNESKLRDAARDAVERARVASESERVASLGYLSDGSEPRFSLRKARAKPAPNMNGSSHVLFRDALAPVTNGSGGQGGMGGMGGGQGGLGGGGGQGGFGGGANQMGLAIPILGDLSAGALPNGEAKDRIQVATLPNYRYQRPPVVRTPRTPGTETYEAFRDSGFVLVGNEPLSTFSIDVDTAAYANMRRFLKQGQLPPRDSVRVEELINYFKYDYAGPDGEAPFAAHMAVASAPWRPEHRLVRIALKGAEMARDERPAANLVFLLDVSGSMRPENKLPLVKRAIGMLTEQLNGADRVAIVTYAGSSGVALPSTRGDRIDVILNAVEGLQAGGSTNGASGIELAYRIATENFIMDGINRVILATDGDFNVGVTSRGDLERLIEDKARSGVFLTIAGFGIGNLKDATLETLSNKGNGNYAYIDTVQEARKVFVEDLMGTLVTIAKDVKIQVEFNPAQVAAYRLIGYENRALAPQDFNNDRKDAGEIGAGHTVTALYEIVPAGMRPPGPSVDPLRYREGTNDARAALPAPPAVPDGVQAEMLTLKLRYKEPDGSVSKLFTVHLTDPGTQLAAASADFKFAAAVACFGQMLRQSPHVAGMDYNSVMALAEDGMASDSHGYRAEFIDLLRVARPLLSPTYRTSRVQGNQGFHLELLNLQEASDGTWRVLIRSPSRKGWYSVGDAFESYEILSIDPFTECIIVFVEALQRRVEICK